VVPKTEELMEALLEEIPMSVLLCRVYQSAHDPDTSSGAAKMCASWSNVTMLCFSILFSGALGWCPRRRS
jgi:hypothetical protein